MPLPTTYTSQELCASREGSRIYGQLFLPSGEIGDARLPVLVCAHGFGANYLSCVPYAWRLAENGFAVYCFDFCGGGYASRSEGNPLDMTVETECADIVAVVEMLHTQPRIDPERVYLMGEDQGGFAAVLYACAYREELAGLVLLHPSLNLHDQAKKLFPTKKNIPVSYRQQGMRVGRAYGEFMWDTNPYAYMRAYAGDVLIVHGDEDTAVPLDYAHRAMTVYPHARLQVIHGGKHMFRGEVQAEAVEAVVGFLTRIANN